MSEVIMLSGAGTPFWFTADNLRGDFATCDFAVWVAGAPEADCGPIAVGKRGTGSVGAW